MRLLFEGYSQAAIKEKSDETTEDGSDILDIAFWDGISQDELKEAISRYDEEYYKQIRDEISK